jgi:hypothetical protein
MQRILSLHSPEPIEGSISGRDIGNVGASAFDYRTQFPTSHFDWSPRVRTVKAGLAKTCSLSDSGRIELRNAEASSDFRGLDPFNLKIGHPSEKAKMIFKLTRALFFGGMTRSSMLL